MYPSVNILATCLFLLFGTNLLGQDCQASFTFDETDLTIQFFDQSTSDAGDPIISWFWDFDDGSTSNQQNPTHTFPDPDKYRINLTITTASGCTSTIEIEIETCVLNTNLTIGNCDPNGMIQLTINVSDIYDNAKDIDISVDGQLIPGSPFDIDVDMPVTVNYTMTGDGLPHTLLVQSTDIGSCNTEIDFTLPDCGSNCFLSSFSVNVVGGTTHNVDVGDDFFAPVNTTISLGDIVHFQWIGDGHSTTSDATSGPDSWNSGEIVFGSTYDVNIQNPGVHPYYCIPHGSPGGQGMAGSIIANCPPSNNFTLNLNFSTSIADPAGYNVIVDGVVQAGSPFSYNGTGTQTATITLSGDGLAHQIEIRDVADPSCILSNTWNAPDCGAAPTCSLSSTLVQTGGCNANNNVTIEVTVNAINGGAAGFNIFIDGALASGSPFSYDPSGVTVVNIEVTGDGQSHTITATDVNDSACTVENNITTTDCSIQCVLSNISANTGTPVTHIVEVIDFDFVPKDITIAPDDIVEWQWTGVIDHTTTSDATSGPDSWESGLLNQGATFQKSGLSVGVHPYYCIPHGSPGGVGMAGTITVQASCTNNMVAVAVSFNEVGGSFDGFEVLVDGIVSGTFDYDPSGSNTVSVNVQGDGQSHVIVVQDLGNPSCSISTNITTPDCNASTCALTLSAQETSGCDANDEVNVELTIGDTGGGASGFNVLLDGNNVGTFNYSGTGSTVVNINVPGDGQVHNFQVVDIDDPSCSANTDISTTNCTIPCTISNLVASTGSSTTHIVEVIDFDFVPKDIMIREGDTVRFVWTGIIPHTTTSDIDSGVDSWDSGLLDQGATYDVVINNLGYHPYYCIPHGAPGGIGMAGSITVLPDCDENDQVAVQLSFEEMGGSFSGFQVLVDGNTYGSYNYDSSGTNSISINVTGDNQIHTITVIDLENNTCIASTSITTPDCNFTLPCNLDLSTINIGDCNEDEEVKISLNITSENIGNQGFNLFVDGNLWNGSPFEYNSSNQTMVDVTIIGDGQMHSFVVQDMEFVDCTDSLSIILADCSEPCALNNLQLEAVNGIITTTHIVEVKDFDFAPKDLNINLGDQIRWEWTGIIPHTATSDANSGIDSWDSGLLNQGAIYEYTLETEGNHPYYCIPHGTPGGVGMAGTIFVNPPLADCQNGMGSINISFEVTNPGNNGFSLYIDNNLFEIYNYSGNGLENFNLSVQGDGQSHVIRIEDNDFPECVIEDSLVFPDCNIPIPCSISTSNLQIGECNEENDIQISFQLDYENVGSAYQILIDGNTTSNSPISYTGNGSDLIEITLSGTGQEQIIEIQDIDSSSCSTTLNIELPICGPICEIQNLSVSSAPQRHIVEVKDFEFTPKDLEILIGDTIEFVWTGIIPHTVTSDVLSGDNSFDSGLLGQGASYELILTESGSHPYYCIPHGGPGGVGMAGSIQVLEGCNDEGEALVNVQFTTTNGSDQGYNVFLDGQFYEGPISYQNQMGANSIFLNISVDGANHIITVQDLEVDFCAASTNFTAPDCPGICEIQDLEANSGSNIIHEIEVRDFDFSPSNITVHTGETIRFNWTGQIPHSTTSDATTGVDAWDSGIIGQGSVYDIIIQEPGDHPYYCTPHGGPGGIGMAGNITALPSCENDSINVQINFNITNGSDQGYNIFVDGVLYNTSPILYDDPMGNNSYTISIIGDGENHFITVQDLETNFCATTTQIQVSDCSATCSIENAEIIFPEPELHIIDVFDFGFNPQNITINLGDTLSFIWTGVIPHTVTSDATSGPDSFESGLLGQGATYELVLTTIGDHPYYCIPHGGPGGIGMAGTIHVVDPNCQNGFVSGTLQFTSSATGTEGYNIYIDGNITSDSPYSYAPNGENELDLQLLGDAQIHTIIIADVLDESCSDTLEVQTINCNTNCALSITASTDGNCSAEGDILYELSINSENPGSSFELSIDGILHPDNPFQYDNSGTTLLNILIPGDGQSHNIEVQDLDSLNCNTSLIVNTIDCSPDCLLSINAELLDNCDDEGNLVYQIQVDVTDPESNQFNIWVDNMILPNSPFEYTGGSTIVEITLAGQGQSYEIIVADELSNSCSDTLILDVPNCEDPCELSNLEITIDVPIVHEVEVRDFDFFPKDIIANLGDTVRFIWTGVIPHTATSDATSGDDVWNSGLLGQGAVYDLIINNVGYHPYYCIPHGSPGGIGMAGSITIEEDCDDGLLWTAINFQAENQGTQGFNILVDGTLDTNSPFDYSNRPISIAIPADGLEHHIQIIDEIFSDCGIDSTIIMPDCSDPCYGFEAKFDLIIDYANYSIDLISTTNGASSWSWDFGDGNNGNGEQIQYTFNEPGTYTICLTASNEECTDEFCTTITFEEVFCQALFEYSSNGLNFDFTDQSSASEEIIEWIWTIDDSIFSNDASPNYDFDTLGIFTVCLTINTNNCSSDTCIILDLSDPCLSLTPAFEYTINEEELSISFTDLSGGNPNQWLWGFGDGNTSNEQNPIHYFDVSGTYTVCLLAQNTELNCNATYCEVIQVGIINQVSNFNRNLSLQVFPNPTSSHQQVWTMKGILEKDYLQLLRFNLYDMSGKTILQTSLEGRNEIIFSVPQPLAQGVYFVELESANATYRAKLVIH